MATAPLDENLSLFRCAICSGFRNKTAWQYDGTGDDRIYRQSLFGDSILRTGRMYTVQGTDQKQATDISRIDILRNISVSWDGLKLLVE